MSNNDKLQLAYELIKNKKYKKALLLLKKINGKLSLQTFNSLFLEAACLQNLKKLQLSELIHLKALDKAILDEDKLKVLKNLKNIALSNKNNKLACSYLIKKLAFLDTNLVARNSVYWELCQLSNNINDYQTLENYALKLIGINEYWVDVAFLLVNLYQNNGKNELATNYLIKLEGHFEQLTKQQKVNVILGLFKMGFVDKSKEYFEVIRDEYQHENWCQELERKIYYSSRTEDEAEVTSKNIAPIRFPQDLVIGDNSSVRKLIEKFLIVLKQQGATFHDKLRIIESKGELSIRAYTEVGSFEDLINVPLTCMPLLVDYELTMNDDYNLLLEVKKKQLNKRAIVVMELLVEIYNETNKLKQWSETYSLVLLKNYTDIIEYLINGIAFSKKLKKLKLLVDQNQWNELTISSFLGSRQFSYKQEILKKAGIKTKNKKEHGLLSIIDFLNHKTGAANYSLNYNIPSVYIHAETEPKTKEIFVQYNLNDPISCFLHYGFVDTSMSWSYSITVDMHTQNGTKILVLNSPTKYKSDLSDNLKYLRNFLPGIVKFVGKTLAISNLTIPTTKDHSSLREVLAYILKTHIKDVNYNSDFILLAEVERLENQLISKNKKYWTDLKEMVELANTENDDFPDKAYSDIITLCELNIEIIKNYESYNG